MEEESPGMEIDQLKDIVTEADRAEGETIEAFKRRSLEPYPDPDEWLENNVITTNIDKLLNWARRSTIFPVVCFPACCAFEYIASNASRFDLSRFGMEIIRASPRQADLMITAGTLTWKLAPAVRRIYDQMAEPRWVIAMGACGISGGIFRSGYNVVPGYNKIVPVDVYVPGCPPRPEALIYGIQQLQKKIAKAKVVPDLSELPKIKLPAIPRLER